MTNPVDYGLTCRYCGMLNVAHDSRNFAVEALEEAPDGLVYVACGLLRGRG